MKTKPILLVKTGSTGDGRNIDDQMLEQMAIRPQNHARYSKDWKAISLRIRSLAEGRCESWPDFPDCRAENGKLSPVTGSIILLTFAHLDHQPAHCSGDDLYACSHRCHSTYNATMCRAEIRELAFMDQIKLVLG